MKISVVIPTYNEEGHIGKCLDTLMANTMKPYEVIVIDGGSKDNTIGEAKLYGVTILNNPKRNAAAGRNIGIKYASGDIIAFIDGDCIPDNKWIEEIHNAFAGEKLDGIGGYIEPAPARNEIEEFWANLSLRMIMSFGEKPYYICSRNLNDSFITCNCAYTKELLEKLNGFDEWFANNAEDVDLSWRALAAGAILKYVPRVRIHALSVTTLKGVKRKSFRNGVSSSKLQKRYGRFFNYDKNIYKMLWKNLFEMFKNKKLAKLYVIELIYHLLGKYYGSIKVGIINI